MMVEKQIKFGNMQTFLPYPNFNDSAKVMDHYNAGKYSRCFKQVVEAKQILCNLHASGLPESWVESNDWKNQPWVNHVAVKMWENNPMALKEYYNTFLSISKNTHKVNTDMVELEVYEGCNYPNGYPWWLGNENLHRAMRARLIEKDRDFYLPKFPDDEGFNGGLYLWPTNSTKFREIIKINKTIIKAINFHIDGDTFYTIRVTKILTPTEIVGNLISDSTIQVLAYKLKNYWYIKEDI